MKIKTLYTLLIILGVATLLQAQDTNTHRPFSLEVNPLAYAFQGWSVGGTYQPENLKKWVFNAGAYGFEMPQVFVEQIPGNEDEEFTLNIQSAFTAGADFHPWNPDRSGVAFGMTAVLGNFEVTHENEPGKAEYSSFYVVPRVSYTWLVFKGLYVMPWAGLELHNKISGGTQVGSIEFKPMTAQFSPNISIGYAF